MAIQSAEHFVLGVLGASPSWSSLLRLAVCLCSRSSLGKMFLLEQCVIDRGHH